MTAAADNVDRIMQDLKGRFITINGNTFGPTPNHNYAQVVGTPQTITDAWPTPEELFAIKMQAIHERGYVDVGDGHGED
jgi:hypothetical protein